MADKFLKPSLGSNEQLEESLLTKEPLSYVEHRACVKNGSEKRKENQVEQ